MVEGARAVRRGLVEDSSLHSYSSNARGYVYFYLDRRDTGERILVKTDQIALEVFWQAPDLFKQRIVGMRDEKSLPTNIQYHLDHLVVVQNEFGDRIRIGDGDEVEAVFHPMAPGSEAVYDFLLTDSVTLNLPSTADTVRVYELQVKPKDFDRPGFVGTVYLDRSTLSIVRMSFTFTPSSYVDDYLDHISISLENGLWMNRYWLPFRQQLEIRREVPFLDVPAGSVIRGSFQVRDYQINPPLPATLFSGRSITAVSEDARRSFPFEEGLYAELDDEGLQGSRAPPTMDEIRSMAASAYAERYLSGLRQTRLFLPSPLASSAARYDRAEGVFLGAGLSHTARSDIRLSAYGGFSFGRKRPTLEGRISSGPGGSASALEVFLNRPRDLGPVPAVSGVINSLAALSTQDDFTDLYFASGLQAGYTIQTDGQVLFTFSARWERHRSARDVVSDDPEHTDFRPVLPVDRGEWSSLAVTGSFPTPLDGLTVDAEAMGGRFAQKGFGSLSLELSYLRRWLDRGADLQMDFQAGHLLGTPPLQAYYFLGGRHTVPGYEFRSRVGDHYWLARAEAAIDLLRPFLRLRAFAAAGDANNPPPVDIGPAGSTPEDPFLLAAGLGVGIGWDVLRIDLARGLRDGGDWALILSVRPDFWPWL